jgi:protoporphyrinogen oxidase
MSNKKTVITGSGLSALLMARMIRKYRNPDAEIVIIEKEDRVGGQYGSLNYGDYGYFDVGMHIIYETCIPQIDELIADIMSPEEWIVLENNYKDIAGIYVNGRLQEDTPYIDLRNLPQEQWNRYVAEIFKVISNSAKHVANVPQNAYDVLVKHFGQVITDEIFVPVLEKLYYTHPSGLAEIATKFTTINRLALFNSDTMLDLMKSDMIRARVCFPDQLDMPPYRNNTQRGFYPKEFGMYRVMEKLKQLLEKEGVVFLTGHSIRKMEIAGKTVTDIEIVDKSGNISHLPVSELFWTAGLPGLANTLGLPVKDLVYDRKKTNDVYVNLLFNKKPEMGDLYYFYPFDKGYRSFRVTSYSNYCPSAAGERGFPVCVELWAREEDGTDEQALIALAVNELKAFGVIDDSYALNFAKVEKYMAGFPLPSVTNINNMLTISQRIKDTGLENVIPTGILTEKHIFFIKDVLIDTYQKVITPSKQKQKNFNAEV